MPDMEPLLVIEKYYDSQSVVGQLLINHSRSVANKALAIALAHPELHVDLQFIAEAAMLHDIGIFLCHAPDIGCFGVSDYICHGYLGAELLQKEGFPRHARVCERHTGTGITMQMITEQNLPLPLRDMIPVTLEEQIICFADKFFSKTNPDKEKNISQIEVSLQRHGDDVVARFKNWLSLFL